MAVEVVTHKIMKKCTSILWAWPWSVDGKHVFENGLRLDEIATYVES